MTAVVFIYIRPPVRRKAMRRPAVIAGLSPNGITVYSERPYRQRKAVSHLSKFKRQLFRFRRPAAEDVVTSSGLFSLCSPATRIPDVRAANMYGHPAALVVNSVF